MTNFEGSRDILENKAYVVRSWHVTSLLRWCWCTRSFSIPGEEKEISQRIRVLQQMWKECDSGQEKWKDVPEVEE